MSELRPAHRSWKVAERRDVLDGASRFADHARAVGKGLETLVLDKYLEILVRKPGAMPNATALARAKAVGVFTPVHRQFWDAARNRNGDRQGTVAMIEVLLLHHQLPTAAVLAGIELGECSRPIRQGRKVSTSVSRAEPLFPTWSQRIPKRQSSDRSALRLPILRDSQNALDAWADHLTAWPNSL